MVKNNMVSEKDAVDEIIEDENSGNEYENSGNDSKLTKMYYKWLNRCFRAYYTGRISVESWRTVTEWIAVIMGDYNFRRTVLAFYESDEWSTLAYEEWE